MNLKEAFKIRKKDAETDDVIITIGNHLATEQVFKSEEEAQKVIDGTRLESSGSINLRLQRSRSMGRKNKKKH